MIIAQLCKLFIEEIHFAQVMCQFPAQIPSVNRFRHRKGYFPARIPSVNHFRRKKEYFPARNVLWHCFGQKKRCFPAQNKTFLPLKLLSDKQIPHTMKNKILSILIAIFWVALFCYLIYLKLYAVVILSFILLAMSMAMSTSNDAEC